MKSIKPMLVQLAEPEYMCTDCGYKFFGVKAIEKCPICGINFDLSEPYKLGMKSIRKSR